MCAQAGGQGILVTDLESFIRDRQDRIRGRKETRAEKAIARLREIDWVGVYLIGMIILSNAALIASLCVLGYVGYHAYADPG